MANNKLHKLFLFQTFLVIAVFGCFFSSCSMVHEDLGDCPDGLYIKFVYDYNLERSDMFKDQVGGVTVFIFDNNGYLIKKQSVSNIGTETPLKTYGYTMHIENLNPGKYKLIAFANQKDYEETLKGKGAKYRMSDIQVGDSMSALKSVLDSDPAVKGLKLVENSGSPLDTLWHGIVNDSIKVKDEEPTYTTVSLVRDTKNLNITLRQIEEPTQCPIEDYDIYITDRNGTILYDNRVEESDTLEYTPYAKWNSYFTSEGISTKIKPLDTTSIHSMVAHADLSFNRLLYRNAADKPAMLYIHNNKHNVMIAKINLADVLAEGRNAYEYYNYSRQEYLDRAHDFHLDFFLVGDRWDYINLSISTLPWSIRIQNEDI